MVSPPGEEILQEVRVEKYMNCERCGIPLEIGKECTITDNEGDLYGTICRPCAKKIKYELEVRCHSKISDDEEVIRALNRLKAVNVIHVGGRDICRRY